MNATATAVHTAAEATETLTLSTPCDRCGFVESGAATATFTPSPVAQARVLIRLKSGGILTLCGHHYAEHEPALIPHVDSIDDERCYLTVRPDSGFNA